MTVQKVNLGLVEHLEYVYLLILYVTENQIVQMNMMKILKCARQS
ncbi:unnamed protein product [Schistosoma mattheei]|uniref:Uncharacterized protein n=1 Tax=Schistosoma mattheei TaxID=31246 RepID=A0A183PSB8_9TREM|nr:unnamed protein product [Schistosoma mattheei]